MEDQPQAQAPTTLTGIKLTQTPSSAVGVKAIASALSHISKEVGWRKGIGLLKNLNQKDGFDCPGCAWPDPDAKRAFLAEYCENGAKSDCRGSYQKQSLSSIFCHTFYKRTLQIIRL